ncbi:Rad17 cell cycle checkpoint protein-domain-containing protein [Hygrophoropsis aurantiaca]|uniref:Rad17 cell cycle checkpoint protein-domain-containing protein n=1 Tax=Hygrophoropsis aurantiaca TaxID=72124 RepID=A0ACB7ZWC6_9AGAM|nr:Rad17 cell cycle checkpoint protein-domain-containing protein [Hygrophoropsis aurantiaca]
MPAAKKLRTAKLDLSSERPTKKLRVYDTDDGRLWVDRYEPKTEEDLAVHKRKVEDVRRWLLEAFDGGPSAKLQKYRRILALTGPAGTAKTTTLRVLARELGFDILEWRNSMSDRGSSRGTREEFEALFDKFQAFLTRASTCQNVFSSNTSGPSSSQARTTQSSQSSAQTQTPSDSSKRHLILLEDLPNLLHLPTQARFHAALQSLCTPTASSVPTPPIVVIISDSGLRGEQNDDDNWEKGRQWGKKEVLDVRNVLGPEFNPIAPTLMTKALQALLATHFSSSSSHAKGKPPTRDILDIVVESSNGDIRSAVMALQFACIAALPSGSKSKSKSAGTKKQSQSKIKAEGGGNARAVLEAVTRREQSLVLFHLMGKVLYNKRKNDPPATHLSAKEAAKERDLDALLVDPPPLPDWLHLHERRASRVCIETLASDSPIDSSLLGLYIHQNYTQFCNDVDECDGVCDGLSWMDWVGGHLPAHTPYAFPVATLSTLHALPSPVARRGQKVCKPSWFEVRTAEMEAWNGVGDVGAWLGREEASGGLGVSASAGWSHTTIATELGGWLRAVASGSAAGTTVPQPPRSHRLFSHLPWSSGIKGGDVLGEDDEGGGEDGLRDEDEERDVRVLGGVKEEDLDDGAGWWAEADDIEEAE